MHTACDISPVDIYYTIYVSYKQQLTYINIEEKGVYH